MELLLILIVVFAGGFFAGQARAYWQLREVVRKYAVEELGMKIDAEYNIIEGTDSKATDAKIRALKIEQQKDTLYLFDADTDKFVCQALTVDELAKRVKEVNYCKIAGVVHNDKSIWFVDGKVVETLEQLRNS